MSPLIIVGLIVAAGIVILILAVVRKSREAAMLSATSGDIVTDHRPQRAATPPATRNITTLLESTNDLNALRVLYDDATTRGSEFDRLAVATKLAAVAESMLATAKNYDACWKVFYAIPANSRELKSLERRSLNQAFSFVRTTDEAIAVWDNLPEGDADIEKVLTRALELATCLEDAEAVFKSSEEGSDIEEDAMAKILEFTDTIEGCQEIWDDHGVDTKFGQMAILEAAEIIAANGGPQDECEEDEDDDSDEQDEEEDEEEEDSSILGLLTVLS